MLLIQKTFIIMRLKREYKEGDRIEFISPYTNERKSGEIFQIWDSPSQLFPQELVGELGLEDYHQYFDDNEIVYVVENYGELIDGIKTCTYIQYKHIL